MRIKIMGFGEIGRAVHEWYNSGKETHDIFIYDPAKGFKPSKHTGIDLLSVCIPYTDEFVKEVLRCKGDTQLCVIHSTVPIGTTEQIPGAVFVPVVGKHPALIRSLKEWGTMIGFTKPYNSAYFKFFSGFNSFGMITMKARNLEACKLLSTLLYGVNIEFYRYANDVLNGDIEDFKLFNQNYNKLYYNLGLSQYSRYILDPPEGDIGGHCVRPNAYLLPDSIFTEIVKNWYTSNNIKVKGAK